MRRIILALAMLVASSAQAGVAYHWQTIQTSDTIHAAEGYIEFAGDSWEPYSAPNPICDTFDPNLGCLDGDSDSTVIRFMFMVNGGPHYIEMLPRIPIVGSAAVAFDLDIGLQSIWASNGESSLQMTALQNGFWEITHYASDGGPLECFLPPQCSGAVGRWVPVPLPGTLALMGLGLLLVARRR